MYDVKKVEEGARKLWKKLDLLKRIDSKNKNGEKYFLLDGPPYANFVPHVGHLKTTVMKDLYIRLAMMKGHNVLFQPGFDTHGLPIENMIEKKLNLKSKQDIEKLGIKKFVKHCRESAATNKDLWLDVYEILGAWYAWKKPYLTYENSYLESAWWAFNEQWKKGMIYEGKKSVHWCPHCQTALAGYEVTDSYKMMTDPGVYVLFKLKDRDASLLVFTTTPWTLPSNVAIAVAPDKDYVELETSKGKVILAKKRLEMLKSWEIKYKVVKTFKGKELVGKEYESLLDVPVQHELQKNPNALKVYPSIQILKERIASKVASKKGVQSKDVYTDFVNVEEGTGFVHTAPGHGKTDNEFGHRNKLPDPSPLDDSCKFTDEAGMWAGEYVKKADPSIMEHLEKTGKLFYHEKVTHSYPTCWRCKAPLIFRLSNQWFIKIDSIKDKMLQFNEEVNWQPEFARERFRNWVANAEDWNFSRQRYWGIPIPVWKCADCGELEVVSSLKELQKHAKVPDSFDLHAASEVHLKCKCNGKMTRVPHIFDVWYDSGCAPFASLGYPNNNKALFEKYYPVARVSESQDQIRGWFYSLMFVGVSSFGKAPYKTVAMPGWVLDAKGEKMSKSVGNVVGAKEAVDTYGADAVRFYYCWDTAPYNTTKFNMDTIRTEVTKFFNIYWNLHNFLLAQKVKAKKPEAKNIEDKWILSRLSTVIAEARSALDNFDTHNGARALYEFVIDDLSRAYVQMVRDRLEDDETPLHILNHCLLDASELLASISPHVSETVYQNLREMNSGLKESVHLEPLPEPQKSNKDLEEMMSVAQEVIAAGLSFRDKNQIGVRWPLTELIVESKEDMVEKALKKLGSIVEKQCNVKSVVFKKVSNGVDFKHGKVSLNTKMTPELEAEGFSREVTRRVQQLRKEAGLKKQDSIELVVEFPDDSLKKFEADVAKKVGAKKLLYKKEGKYTHSKEYKVKGKEFKISLKKL